MKKVLSKAFDALFVVVVIVLVLWAYGSLNNRFYRVVTVEGNSMSPTLWFGDLIVVTPLPKEIPVGSIVLMNVNGGLVTHRVIGFEDNGNLITKGDANDTTDDFKGNSVTVVGISRLRLPGFGYPLLYCRYLFSKI